MNPTRALVCTMREEFYRRIGTLPELKRDEVTEAFESAVQEGLLKAVEVLTIKGGL